MRVGYLESLPTVPVGDAVRRVMREARSALEGMGHKVGEIQLTADQVMEARRLYLGLVINYVMGPSLEEVRKNYEEPISSYITHPTFSDPTSCSSCGSQGSIGLTRDSLRSGGALRVSLTG